MEVSVAARVRRPRHEVFSAFCELQRVPERLTAVDRVETVTPGPFDVGTRWRETRRLLRRRFTGERWVTGFDPDRSFRVEGELNGTHHVSRIDFEDDGDGATRVELTFRSVPVTRGGRLLEHADALLVPTVRRVLERDLQEMRAALERE